MISNDRSTTSWQRIKKSTHCERLLFFGLLVGAACASCNHAIGQSNVLKWEIEATVIFITDPDEVFNEVRQGDPVRGSMSYDLRTLPIPIDAQSALYRHVWFDIATMVIENPRTGGEITFTSDPRLAQDVFVSNDEEGMYDFISAIRPVMSPPGATIGSPDVVVTLRGKTDVITNQRLPLQLDLDDWPEAVISFVDLDTDLYLYAEINSLKSVVVPILPGDFDEDGDSDVRDLAEWRTGFGLAGSAIHMDGDADGDFDVDGADFLIWQRQVGQGTVSAFSMAAMPEPGAGTLTLVSLAGCGLALRRAFHGKSDQPTSHASDD